MWATESSARERQHPLPLPDLAHLSVIEQISRYFAVALFIERVQAARADFTITVANALVRLTALLAHVARSLPLDAYADPT